MTGPVFRDGDGDGSESPEHPTASDQRPDALLPAVRPPGPVAPYEPAPSHLPAPAAPSTRSTPSPATPQPPPDHGTLKSLLGAWALSACSRDEGRAVEAHLPGCATCADEARRLRDAVGLLHQDESLDLDPLLRVRVLEGCLGRRPARIPVPEWAAPYDAETARLDALLRDLGGSYWKAPVEVQWFDGTQVRKQLTVGEVICHLTSVDSLVGRALGLPLPVARTAADPGRPQPAARARLRRLRGENTDLPLDPWERTAAHWAAQRHLPGGTLRALWREQSHGLVRTVSFAGRGASGLAVDYGSFALPLRDAFVDRAFECWIHAWDIAEAVDYPYEPPAPRNLHRMIDLAARMLPLALAERRRAGLTTSASKLVAAGSPGRSLRLEIEGDGGGDWYLPLDSPGALASADGMVAHVAMDSVEFCQLAAGHIEPERIALGQMGDRDVIRDVIFATASLSRI
ncbi:maleylpyruvate isomerase N-terminal domain-containing protein [Streptomyces sp. NBC_01190]|uniref:maleylpyruvate isomerase N-terminal domain-containing protein n=1 Tax=Streptomyces sp. NBC_01190 TaxID=2903767 RepID=UPI003867D70B|nr:maleylpyruvate isomerase N-terminal domain-containing protein [Streptomyces sp. NBC_01190]